MSEAAESLRRRAAQLPHAVRHDRQLDPAGKVLSERTHHYLTCVRCELERQADELERSSG